jgi:hypothetical protein
MATMPSAAMVASVGENFANGKWAKQEKCNDSNPLFFHDNPFAIFKDSSALTTADVHFPLNW